MCCYVVILLMMMIRVVSGKVWGKEGVYRHLELATILWVGDEEESGRDAVANVSP